MTTKLLDQAQNQHQQGQLNEALETYCKILKEDPQQPDVYHWAGIVLSQLERFSDALIYFDSAIKYDPRNATFYNSKANALVRLGKLVEATLAYDRALKVDPTYVTALTNLANCFYRQKKINDAKKCYQKAIRLRSDFPSAHFNYARLLAEYGEYDSALKELEQTLSIDPTHTFALSQIAHIYMHLGRYSDAIKYYQQRLELESNPGEAHHNLGLAFLKNKHYATALTHLKTSLDLNYHDKESHYHLATAYIHLGNYTEALKHYLQQLECEPHIDSYYNIGVLHLYQERHQEAIDYFREVVERKPDYTDAHLNLAAIYLKLSKINEAINHYELALQQRPSDPEIMHILSALKGDRVAGTAPIEYSQHLFDQYAPYYDQHLIKHLGYQAPKALYEAVTTEANADNPRWRILDLGCGTGLCGEYFKPCAKELIGIDVSTNMLAIAENKKIYDKLENKTLQKALDQYKDLDLIIAADVFTYLGDLNEIFKKAKTALVEKGYFAFTVEKSSHDLYELQKSIRYAHSKKYLKSLIKEHGFKPVRLDNIILREQHKKSVEGYLIVLRA